MGRLPVVAALAALAALAAWGGAAGAAPATPGPAAPAACPPASGPVLDGTPPVPEGLRARLQPYLEVRAADLADVSDDGHAVLIRTRLGDATQVHIVSAPGGDRRQLTFGHDPAAEARLVPGQASAIVYRVDKDGDEQFQIVRLDPATGRATRLTDGKSRNQSLVWSHDGKQLAWASTARNGHDFDIWIGDGARPESAHLAVQGKGDWDPVDFSGDGKRLLVQETISITQSRLHLADLATGAVTDLGPASPAAAYRDGALSPDGKRAYVTSDRDGEFVQLYEVDLAKNDWRSLTAAIPWNVDEIELSQDGATLAYVVNEGGLGRLHLYDTRAHRDQTVTAVPDGVVRGLAFARKAPLLGFTLDTATDTDAYTYDLRKHKVVRWTESELGGLSRARLVAPTLVQFKTFDGARIPAWYYRPAGAGPFPVLVSIHGGPEVQARPRFDTLTQYLVSERAVAVLVPNVRGSDGYGKTYLTLDNGLRREDSVKDIGALLDWIAAQKELDHARVAVYGGSYGGYMVLASLIHFGDRLRAGIDVVGISSFVTFLSNTAEYRRDLRRAEYGDERDPAVRKALVAMSPLTRAGEIRSALFVAQGANDPRVPASEARQIVAAARAHHRDVWFMLAPDEGHGFLKRSNRDAFLYLCALFLERQLALPPAP